MSKTCHSKLSIYDYPKILDSKSRIKVMGKLISGKKSADQYKPIEVARKHAIDELIFENPAIVFTENDQFFENERLICKPALFADGVPVIAKYSPELGYDIEEIAQAAAFCIETEKIFMLLFNEHGNYFFDTYSATLYVKQYVAEKVERFFADLEKMLALDVSETLEIYDDLKTSIELAEEKRNEIMEVIIAKCGEQDTVFSNGRKLLNIQKKGSIDYGKLVKEKLPDIDCEPYRRKPSNYWTIK